jgi:hypothetical protein
LDVDGLTAAEQEALKLLTAGALVERRVSVRLRMIGHAVAIEATATVTGEYGLVEGFEPVAKEAWQAWSGDYLKGKAGAPQDQPTFHCEQTGPQQVRLTQDGQKAREDVEAGRVRTLLDFVHKRTLVFVGNLVRGYGRAEKIETRPAPAQPVQVELVNAGPMAVIAEAVQKLFEAQTKAQQDRTPDDLITAEVAAVQYGITKATIRRRVKNGDFRDFRPAGAGRSAKLIVSRADLERFYTRRK